MYAAAGRLSARIDAALAVVAVVAVVAMVAVVAALNTLAAVAGSANSLAGGVEQRGSCRVIPGWLVWLG